MKIISILFTLFLIFIYYYSISYLDVHLGTMDPWWGTVTFIFVPLVGIPSLMYVIDSAFSRILRIKKIEKEIKRLDFNVTHKISLGDYVIFADGNASEICVAEVPIKSEEYSHHFYDSETLLTSKIIVDEHDEVASASTGSVVGRAIVGGVLFGGAGAIVGGVTAKTVSRKNIKSIQLRLIVDSEDSTSHRINFYNYQKGAPVSSNIVKSVLDNISKWQVIMELVMLGEKIPEFDRRDQLEDHIDYIRLKVEKSRHE